MDENGSWGYIFAFQVLPTVVFFSALTSLFYYWKIIPKIVYAFAWIMKKTLKLSGPESVAAAGNIFLGQTEAPLLVKPYLNKMTNSEIMCLMCGGMATIAGGVLSSIYWHTWRRICNTFNNGICNVCPCCCSCSKNFSSRN